MAMLRTLMNQRITVESHTGQDAYGAPTFGAPVTYWGRVVLQNQSIQGEGGIEITSNMAVYLDTVNNLSIKDRVTLPEGYEPQQPPITRIYKPQNSRGPHHTVVYF